jgi:hypothetical protein
LLTERAQEVTVTSLVDVTVSWGYWGYPGTATTRPAKNATVAMEKCILIVGVLETRIKLFE